MRVEERLQTTSSIIIHHLIIHIPRTHLKLRMRTDFFVLRRDFLLFISTAVPSLRSCVSSYSIRNRP